MKSLAVILGFSCMLAVALTGVWGQPSISVDTPEVDIGLGIGGRGGGDISSTFTGNNSAQSQLADQLANTTAELVKNLLIVIGCITEGVHMILDGICPNVFKLYDTFLYPILDCLTAILGIQDALCGVSDTKCIRELLAEAAEVANRTEGDDLIGLRTHAHISIGLGPLSVRIDGRKKRDVHANANVNVHAGGSSHHHHGERSNEGRNTTTEEEVGPLANYLAKFPPGSTDRKYAILTLKLLALVVEVVIYLSIRLHVPVVLLCPEQRKEYGYDTEEICCPFTGKATGGSKSAGGPGGSTPAPAKH